MSTDKFLFLLLVFIGPILFPLAVAACLESEARLLNMKKLVIQIGIGYSIVGVISGLVLNWYLLAIVSVIVFCGVAMSMLFADNITSNTMD